ncbi:hypothetical protein KKC13_05630 [bacterium]|nr:hypothetical protein [bacterium]MBU1957329.1 hypothetical protein [bacterium]
MKTSILFIMIILLLQACGEGISNDAVRNDTALIGVTLDSITDIDESVDALKSLPKPIVTRVVFDQVPATEYEEALKKLAPYSMIMGELFDSEYINNYSMDEYNARVDEYLDAHGDKVALWEIGNEVNGEWTGVPSEVAQKTLYGYQEAKKRGYKTALTLYYNDFKENDGCWANPEEKMRDWAKSKLDPTIKEGVDYVFVSYYEEDCDHHRPTQEEWEGVFLDLGEIFPNSKLGFGEVGVRQKSQKKDYLERYYTLKINHPRFVGGYFWWYFKQDMVPKSKELWSVLETLLKKH